ncbi:sigma-70 family RNA polymerase sigma factor [Nocardioides panacis]|uniref:RNA polymerase sigma factor n=1 Tax=Nocardioides panacis TaxID=2849501 RepID=A0A975SZ65_9ACTN|nr:sigma-70 family RNA polymerase sigma factor [Nocardioides panacis]QWZ08683.1 sigma-70 family RNA polymerase sigma factor [Nocardioides panacis]
MTVPVHLTSRQERDLVVATEAGDAEACRRLVDAFLPAISAQARHFPIGDGVLREELLQEGVVGLLSAARRYDATRNVPFWAYASFWVRKAMQRLVAELTRPVALSDRAARDLAALVTARSEHLQARGAEPTSDELVRATGLSRPHLEHLELAARTPRSLDQPGLTGDAEGAAALRDQLPDGAAELAFETVLDALERHDVLELTERLGDRERVVVRAHYGIGVPQQTLRQIGDRLGVTAERARQIEVSALGHLRNVLADTRDLDVPAPRGAPGYASGPYAS